ncbi:hypothetical protein C7S15_3335 [Burkholderia cepacia]|nr:hypothetical protein [Burkholderia cepacia]
MAGFSVSGGARCAGFTMAGFYRNAGTAGGNRASNPRAGAQPVAASAPPGMTPRPRALARRFTNIKL